MRFPPTGTGRDGYILTDDGGTHVKYQPQGVQNSTCHMRFGKPFRPVMPQAEVKYQKYISDGSGRDIYVCDRHGGQFSAGD
jgi:hypothetical protein